MESSTAGPSSSIESSDSGPITSSSSGPASFGQLWKWASLRILRSSGKKSMFDSDDISLCSVQVELCPCHFIIEQAKMGYAFWFHTKA